ncbi:hypothetical protein EMPG_17357 [Blastomyces silverae]|uniref:Uncharacterized protein n=1 Tax=Blastomyces silverae TaxID=2060906 RepID=A0A0H1B6X8_9EURO|nr:hypothetical protein EMPG_17357 [Blastomyces silverae]
MRNMRLRSVCLTWKGRARLNMRRFKNYIPRIQGRIVFPLTGIRNGYRCIQERRRDDMT